MRTRQARRAGEEGSGPLHRGPVTAYGRPPTRTGRHALDRALFAVTAVPDAARAPIPDQQRPPPDRTGPQPAGHAVGRARERGTGGRADPV